MEIQLSQSCWGPALSLPKYVVFYSFLTNFAHFFRLVSICLVECECSVRPLDHQRHLLTRQQRLILFITQSFFLHRIWKRMFSLVTYSESALTVAASLVSKNNFVLAVFIACCMLAEFAFGIAFFVKVYVYNTYKGSLCSPYFIQSSIGFHRAASGLHLASQNNICIGCFHIYVYSLIDHLLSQSRSFRISEDRHHDQQDNNVNAKHGPSTKHYYDVLLHICTWDILSRSQNAHHLNRHLYTQIMRYTYSSTCVQPIVSVHPPFSWSFIDHLDLVYTNSILAT